jgi:hypothetical protein
VDEKAIQIALRLIAELDHVEAEIERAKQESNYTLLAINTLLRDELAFVRDGVRPEATKIEGRHPIRSSDGAVCDSETMRVIARRILETNKLLAILVVERFYRDYFDVDNAKARAETAAFIKSIFEEEDDRK